MRHRWIWLVPLLTLALGERADAFCLDKVTGATAWAAWSTQPVPYRVSDNLQDAGLLGAIGQAFATWGAVPCATLGFTPAGTFPIGTDFVTATSHLNVFWVDQAASWPTGIPTSYYAYLYRFYDTSGVLIGGHIAINAFTYSWDAAGGNSTTFDTQSTLTHLIGLVIGLEESKVPGTVMYPDVTFGQTSKRTLTTDDQDAIRFLYLAPGCTAPPAPGPDGCSGTPPPADGGVPLDAALPPTDLWHPDSVSPAKDSAVPAKDSTSPPKDGPTPNPDGAVPSQDGPIASGDGRPSRDGTTAGDHSTASDRSTTGPRADGGVRGDGLSRCSCAPDEICTLTGTCVRPASSSPGCTACRVAQMEPADLPLGLLALALLLGTMTRRRGHRR